jgi:hypothetical protein
MYQADRGVECPYVASRGFNEPLVILVSDTSLPNAVTSVG